MALYIECKEASRQQCQGRRLTTPRFHNLVSFLNVEEEPPRVDVPISNIRFGGPTSVGSKTASTISEQGYPEPNLSLPDQAEWARLCVGPYTRPGGHEDYPNPAAIYRDRQGSAIAIGFDGL
jgi:hypothetical protein